MDDDTYRASIGPEVITSGNPAGGRSVAQMDRGFNRAGSDHFRKWRSRTRESRTWRSFNRAGSDHFRKCRRSAARELCYVASIGPEVITSGNRADTARPEAPRGASIGPEVITSGNLWRESGRKNRGVASIGPEVITSGNGITERQLADGEKLQ